MSTKKYEPAGRSFTEVIRSILNEAPTVPDTPPEKTEQTQPENKSEQG